MKKVFFMFIIIIIFSKIRFKLFIDLFIDKYYYK